MSSTLHRLLPSGILFLVLAVPGWADDKPEPIYEGKKLSGWIAQLNSPKAEEREQAAQILGRLFEQTRATVPDLLRIAQQRLATGQMESLGPLQQLGPGAVPALTRALWDDNPRIRAVAAWSFTGLGIHGRPAAPSLKHLLHDEIVLCRSFALRALNTVRAHEAASAILEALADRDELVRSAALHALGGLEVDPARYLPTLSEWLTGKDHPSRVLALEHLRSLGPAAADAVPALRDLLRDDNAAIRSAATKALAAMGSTARPALPALLTRLKERTRPSEQLETARALWLIGRSPEVGPFLEKHLPDLRGQSRLAAADLLWCVNRSPRALDALTAELGPDSTAGHLQTLFQVRDVVPPPVKVLPAVRSLLKDPNADVRNLACQVLGQMGKEASPAVADLTATLKDKEPFVRGVAATALWDVAKKKEGLDELVRLLNDDNPTLRRWAATTLGLRGPEARETVPALEKAIRDPHPVVRVEAANALWTITRKEETCRLLASMLQDGDATVRSTAAVVLGLPSGEGAVRAVPALVRALWDDDSRVRSNAAEALGRIGSKAQQALPALLAILDAKVEEDHVVSAATEAVGLLGKESKPAMTALRMKLKHPIGYVRALAALGLSRIEKDPEAQTVARKCLSHPHVRARICAAEALWHFSKDRQAITVLRDVLTAAEISNREALSDAQLHETLSNVRFMAVRALGRIGPEARSAVPLLLDLLRAEDRLLRAAVAEALTRIDPEAARKAGLP